MVLYLGGGGRAGATMTDGTLSDEPGPAGADTLVHDPWRPAPTLGGHAGQPGGMQDRRAVDDCADVACFTAYPVNPGTGGGPHETRAEDERVITLRIAHGGATASSITLPVAA